jgi:hypothetical protein
MELRVPGSRLVKLHQAYSYKPVLDTGLVPMTLLRLQSPLCYATRVLADLLIRQNATTMQSLRDDRQKTGIRGKQD